MSKPLFMANGLLALISALLLGYIVVQATAPFPPPPAARIRPPASAAATQSVEQTPPAPGSYAVVASRNLFSPTRSEVAGGPATATAALNLPKPNLYGVVLRDGAPIAYIEDPATKRVAGYRVGDNVAGGTVQAIAADHIVIARPEGTVDVRLRDPSRPRPQVSPAVQPGGRGPGQPVEQPAVQPGMPQPVPPAYPPGFFPPGQPSPPIPGAQIVPPGQQVIPGRRALPPNLLRRVPPGAGSDAQR
jgi:hypothetical protein